MEWTCGHAWRRANLERPCHWRVNHLTGTHTHTPTCSWRRVKKRNGSLRGVGGGTAQEKYTRGSLVREKIQAEKHKH